MAPLISYLAAELRHLWRTLRTDDRGMAAETVIIVALMATLALAVGAIIVVKVTAKANSINLG